ncbi:hypothetical protein ABPG74_010878 [Tetrahymena malaccensis]
MRAGGNIKEELRKFRQVKYSQGLLDVNLNRTFENSKDLIKQQGTNSFKNDTQLQKKRSPILIANELEFNTSLEKNFFSNPILNGILSPNTVQKLELVKKMDAIEERQKNQSQDLLFTDEDKENVNTINNAIVSNKNNQQQPIKFTFEHKKSNNRYISQDQLALSRNTIFTTDKSFDFIDFKQNNTQHLNNNSRILEKEKNEQTATFSKSINGQIVFQQQNYQENQFTLECGGCTEREKVDYNSIDGNLTTPLSNAANIMDMNKKVRFSRSKDNSILDHEIVSFYQNIKASKEKQMKTLKKSDAKSQLNISQIEQKSLNNTQKPPKKTNNMTIKTDLLNDSILNKSLHKISNNNNLTVSSISLLKSCNQNSTILLSASPYNTRKSKSDRGFTRSLTPVNQCPQSQGSNTIEIKKLNLFEEDELRQQIDILLKEKEQDKLIIQSLSEDNKYLQKLSENSQQNHRFEIENHKMQIDMLQEKIFQQEAHIKHLTALNSLSNSQIDKEELDYLKNENANLREEKFQVENQAQQLNFFLNEKVQENMQLAEQIIFLRTELDKYSSNPIN